MYLELSLDFYSLLQEVLKSQCDFGRSFFFLGIYQNILKQCRTAVSGKFLYTSLVALMQSIYTKKLFYVFASKNFTLFYGGVTENPE